MLNKPNHFTFVCLLCVTLFFTMGFGIHSRINNQTIAASEPTVSIESKVQVTNDHSSTPERPESDLTANPPQKSDEPSPLPVSVSEAPSIEPLPDSVANVTSASYEITAFYLNVRAEANSTSNIVDVVTKGRVVEVLQSNGNEWLELKSGGYIHGSYAKLISEEVKPGAPAETVAETVALSDKPAVSAEPSKIGQAPQPAAPVKLAEPSKPTSSVKSNSGLTEEHIAKIIENTPLEGEGLEKAILEIENVYGINSYFTIAVMKLESGHGKSKLAKTKNNLFGLNALDSDAYNKALSFNTKGDSVKEFGYIISEFYIDKGLTSVENVARKYCGANTNWPTLVKSIMNSDYKKII